MTSRLLTRLVKFGSRLTCPTSSKIFCPRSCGHRWCCAKAQTTPWKKSVCASSRLGFPELRLPALGFLPEGFQPVARLFSEAAGALGEIAQGAEEINLAECRPVGVGKPDFRIRGLPQQEAG